MYVLVALAGLTLLLAPTGAQAATSPYKLVRLGTLGGASTFAAAVNEAGVVVGTSRDRKGRARAFQWRNGRMISLGTLGGATSAAADINDRGQIVGASATSTGALHGFLWHRGKMTDLGALSELGSAASDINDKGLIVGSSRTPDGVTRAVAWRRGVIINLTPNISDHAHARFVNNRGQIAGSTRTDPFLWYRGELRTAPVIWSYDFQVHALNERGAVALQEDGDSYTNLLLWRGDKVSAGGGLGWKPTSSGRYSLNDRGQLVGRSSVDQNYDGPFHAFLQTRGISRDLGTLGGRDSSAQVVNNSGLVAGLSETRDGRIHAFAWRRGRMTDLGRFGKISSVTVVGINAINDRGMIVGTAQMSANVHRALVWVPSC